MSEHRGFCKTKEQERDLLEYGLPARAIFMDGRGAETLEICLETFRDRPGSLILASDIRLFGATRRKVAEVMAGLERAKIRVIDISHAGDVTIAQLIARANTAIANNHFEGDRQKARRRGRKGGAAKGTAAAEKRNLTVPKDVVDRIVDCREIPWAIKAYVLGPGFTKHTLRRRYGSNPTDPRE